MPSPITRSSAPSPIQLTSRKPDAIHPQRLARADHDAAARRIELDDIERRAGGDAQSLALADGEMNDALMPADDAAVEIDDVAGLDRVRASGGR